jgi:hypothetical protein
MRLRSWIAVALVAVVVGNTSCARDNPTAPASDIAPPAHPAAVLLPGPTTIVPLQRLAALEANQQASATIGIFGGAIALPGAGLMLVVPPFAVLSPTTITVTALAGSNVAYEFAPHGLRFLAPALAVQSLQGTQAGADGPLLGRPLFVGYFANSELVSSVTELLNAPVNVFSLTSTTALWHFSGYVWSSGREGEPADSTSRDQ